MKRLIHTCEVRLYRVDCMIVKTYETRFLRRADDGFKNASPILLRHAYLQGAITGVGDPGFCFGTARV